MDGERKDQREREHLKTATAPGREGERKRGRGYVGGKVSGGDGEGRIKRRETVKRVKRREESGVQMKRWKGRSWRMKGEAVR